jgi:hypothetical protein
MAAYIALDSSLDALQKAGYATVFWVNSKVGFFTAFGAQYAGTQRCDANLTISSPLGNNVVLSNNPSVNSHFSSTVDFEKSISVKGSIANTNASSALDIKSTSNDLNLTSTTRAINLNAGTEIAFNAPQVINSGDLKVDNIKPIAAQDETLGITILFVIQMPY